MRKHLTASLSACLVAACFTGCGDKSQEAQVSEKLGSLLDQMSRLQYADAPIEGNKLEYTLGKEVDGVQVPGSIRFEAAYLDQALALLPLAEDIKKDGSKLQQQSANAIIGSIRTDEAAFLIDEAERAFQQGASRVVSLHGKVALLREIQATNNAVAGDRAEVIKTYRAGLNIDGTQMVGIDGLSDQAAAAASQANQASQDLASYSQQMSDLREKVVEYEALELKLTGASRIAKAPGKFEKLDQATVAAKEAETAQMQAQKLEIDAWISERMGNLATLQQQRLSGDPGAEASQLLGKLSGFFQEASEEATIPPSSDTYMNLEGMLSQAKAGAGDDTTKTAAFLLNMSDYGTAPAGDQHARAKLVGAIDRRVSDYLGVVGVLEMKVAQIKLDRQRIADKLADIERDRQAVRTDLASVFTEQDALIQVAGFDRIKAAITGLEQAAQAVQAAGSGNDMELMSVYLLHARALQQQNLSARTYLATLNSIASAGPDILGGQLHQTLTSRVDSLKQLISQASTAGSALQAAAAGTSSNVLASVEAESDRGKIASRQMEVYQSLLDSLK